MTDKILSQEEIDALLKGVQSGDIDTESAKEQILSGLRPYDFTSQERIIRGRMPGLEIANEGFIRLFRNSISTLTMRFIDVTVYGTKILKFSDFIKTIPMPSNINLFKMKPLKGMALFVMEAPLVFAFIEFFFGGTNTRYFKPEGRAFTPIEQRVIQKVVKIGLNDLASAWSGIAPIEPEYVGSEMNPQFVTIVAPTELVISIEIHIEIENFTGKMFLCIPYSMIEPVKEKLYSGLHADKLEIDQRWTKRLKEMLMDCPLRLHVEMGTAELTFGDLMNFRVGSVIILNKPVSEDLIVKVEDVPKFKGMSGISRGNQAVKITGEAYGASNSD